MKKTVRSIVALLLVCAMLVGLPGIPGLMMTAKATGSNATSGDTLKVVSFGDSMTNGYGLTGYALPNGVGVNGFLQESQVAYPKMFADYLAGQTGKAVDLLQLAVSGMRTEDLLFTLSYDWKQDWEPTDPGEDGNVHRHRAMTEKEFYDVYAPMGYDYQTLHHFILNKSSDLNGWWAYPTSYFCAECEESFLGTYYDGVYGAIDNTCEHFKNLPLKQPWTVPGASNQKYTWDQLKIPADRGPVYFYANNNKNMTANDQGSFWFSNAMAAYAGQFQTAVKDADVITVASGNANFGVYLLSRMISAMGVLPGFGSPDYCWDPTLNKGMGGYDPTLTQNFEYSKIRAIVDAEQDPLMLAMADMAEDIVGKNMGTFASMMGVTNEANIAAMENIILYTTISYMRAYGMLLDRIATLNPDATVIIVGNMNAFKGMTMVMDDDTHVDLRDTFEELFGLLNVYLTALATMKQENFQLTGEETGVQEETVDHSGMTYIYADMPTVEVLADVFYTEEGIYSTDPTNVIRDRFIEDVCSLVFMLMKDALPEDMPGGIKLVTIDRDQVESYEGTEGTEGIEGFAEKWAAAASAEEKYALIKENTNTNEIFSSAVYLGFEKAIAVAGQSGTMYMDAIQKTNSGFDAVFGPIADAMTQGLVSEDEMDEISTMVPYAVADWVESTTEKQSLLNQVTAELDAKYDDEDFDSAAAKAAFAIVNKLADLNKLKYVISISDTLDAFEDAVFEAYKAELKEDAAVQNMFDVAEDWAFGAYALRDASADQTLQYLLNKGTIDQSVIVQIALAMDGGYLPSDCLNDVQNALAKLEKAMVAYGTDAFAPYYISANITDALYVAMMTEDEDYYIFETLLNMFARMVIGDGLGQHPSVGGHMELEAAVENAYANKVTAAEHTEQAVGDAAQDYADSMDADHTDLLANALYEAATTGEYTPGAQPYYLAISDGKLTGFENKLATSLYGENPKNYYNVFADGSVRADDLLYVLSGATETDAYFKEVGEPALWKAMHGEQYKVEDLSELTTDESTALRTYLATELAKADLITVSVGPSSMAYAANNPVPPTKEQWLTAMGEEKGGYAVKAFETIGGLAGAEAGATAESLAWCNTTHKATYPALVDLIHSINPNAHVVLLGYFDSTYQAEDTMPIMGMDMPIGKVYSALNVEGDNIALQYAIEHNENTTFVKVRDDDAALHRGVVEELILNALEVGHNHNFGTTYDHNEEAHWLVCQTPGCTVEDFSEIADSKYASHDFTANAYVCVCGYSRGVAPEIKDLVGATYTINQGPVTALTVEATVPTGGVLTYQWYKSDFEDVEGTAISGATEASYEPSIAAIGTAYYYCKVTNTYGEGDNSVIEKATSNVVAIEVIDVVHAAAPTITTQPVGKGYLDTDTTAAALMIAAEVADAGTLTYQWFKNTTNTTEGGTAIEGATGTSYKPAIGTVGTTYYYCVVTSTNNAVTGAKTAKTVSDVVAVVVDTSVNAATPVITAAPQSATYVQGAVPAALTIEATSTDAQSGGSLTYQWYLNGTAVEGATGTTYTPATDAVGTFEYYCEVTNTNNSVNGVKTAVTKSAVAAIVVEVPVNAAAPLILKQPAVEMGIYALNAAAEKLSVKAYSSDEGVLSYQWYVGETAIAGATNATYVPATNVEGTFAYRCEVTNTNENATGSQKAVSVFTETVTIDVKNMDADTQNILEGVLALTNVSDPNAGRNLNTVLGALEEEYSAYLEQVSSGTYYVGDSNVYLALGGTTTAEKSGYVSQTSTGLKNKGAEKDINFQFTVDNNGEYNLSILNMASYIRENKSAIAKADFITYQVEASSIAEYMLDTEIGTPAWPSEYAVEKAKVAAYLDTLQASITAQLTASLDSMVASTAISRVNAIVLPMVERLMYAATVYFHESADNLAAIRNYNPDAMIVAVGMNNPVYGLNKLQISGEIYGVSVDADLDFNFSDIFAQVVEASNMSAAMAAMQDPTGNTIYVELPTTSLITGGLPTVIDLDDALASPPLGKFKNKVLAGMTITANGQKAIANSIVNAVDVALPNTDVEDDGSVLAGFAAAYKAASLTLEGDITINYKAQVTAPEGTPLDYKVGSLFWSEKPNSYTVDANPDLIIEQGDDAYRYESDKAYHVFSYNDVAAKELNDDIYSVVYVRVGDEYVYSEPLTYSVAKCAKTVLSTNSSANFKTLAVDLLNYGSAAQTYFGYRTDALANASLTTAQKQLGTQNNVELVNNRASYGEVNDYVAFTSASLFLENIISMNLKATVQPMEGYEVQNVKMIYDDAFTSLEDWEAARGSMTAVTMAKDGSVYEGAINNIVAKALRNSYYAQVAVTYTNGAGSTVTEYSQVLKFSVADLAYLVRNGNQTALKPLTEAMMKYGDSAEAYFETLN